MSDVDREIAAREQELTELRETKTNMAKDVLTNSHEGQLAIFLHDNLCHYNHSDGCDWGYAIHDGIHNWNTHAHERYLNAAESIINHGHNVEEVISIINIIKACT
jgi:hypothetical protein